MWVTYRLVGKLPLPVVAKRAWVEILARANPGRRDVPVERLSMAGIPAERVGTDGADGRVILYLHGGSYVFNSAHVYRSLTTALAARSGATVYVPNYRRAPEHPFPAARDDALSCYRWLLDRGHEPASVAFVGDSAGGGLCLAAAHALRDDGRIPAPAALALLCPWTDLSLSGASIREKAREDFVLSPSSLADAASWYRGAAPLTDPGVSPLFADHTGLGPMLVQAASEDLLAADSVRLAERAAAAGVHVHLEVYEGLFHDFQAHERRLTPAAEALERIAVFLRRHWGG
jgi:monoterpene epsilon-lactone hydrolase